MRVFTVLFAAVAVAASVVAQKVQVKIEERVVVFDVAPMERNGITMVAVRSMLDAMDSSMKWDIERQVVTGWKNSRKFEVVLNSREARVNDKIVTLEEPAYIHRGRIFVPLKFVAEATGHLISRESSWYVLRPTIK